LSKKYQLHREESTVSIRGTYCFKIIWSDWILQILASKIYVISLYSCDDAYDKFYNSR